MTAATLAHPSVRPHPRAACGDGVVVTGIGLVSAAGSSLDALQASLLRRQHCLRPITSFEVAGMTMRLAGEVADFDPLEGPPLPRARRLDRGTQMALNAARQALAQAGLDAADLEAAGVAVGVSGGTQYQNFEVPRDRQYPVSRISALYSARATPSFQADALARAFGLGGPRLAFASASLGGLLALRHAMELLWSGHAPAMVVGGGEINALINALGMDAMGVTSPTPSTPFAGDGAGGICFGEGAAFFVLELASAAAARGAAALGELVGTGATADGYGDLAPDPSGAGLARAVGLCLTQAEVAPSQVGWVRACGTGHRSLDQAESLALRSVFNGVCPPVTSSEPYFGHVNGVSPLLGLAAVLAAQGTGQAPSLPEPTALRPSLGLAALPPGPLPAADCLVTVTAFGGSNGALLVRGMANSGSLRHPVPRDDRVADDVVIAGVGAVSTFGVGTSALVQALGLPPPARPEADAVRRVDDSRLPTTVAGVNLRSRERVARMVAVAAAEALSDGGMGARHPARVGLLVGLTRGPMSAYERFFQQLLQGRFDLNTGRSLLRMARFSVASGLAHDFGLRGYSAAMACGVHGGVQLLAHGAQVLRSSPELDGLLVVAGDEWTPLLAAMYRRLGLLPAGPGGEGCLGGEGAAAVLLRRRAAGAHAADDWASVQGTAFAGDTTVEPDPQGMRYGRAVAAALNRARCAPTQLGLAIGQACGWDAHDRRERAALAWAAPDAQAASVLAHTGVAESAGGLFGAIAAAAALRDGRHLHGSVPGQRVQHAVLMGSTERGSHAAVVLGALQT